MFVCFCRSWCCLHFRQLLLIVSGRVTVVITYAITKTYLIELRFHWLQAFELSKDWFGKYPEEPLTKSTFCTALLLYESACYRWLCESTNRQSCSIHLKICLASNCNSRFVQSIISFPAQNWLPLEK